MSTLIASDPNPFEESQPVPDNVSAATNCQWHQVTEEPEVKTSQVIVTVPHTAGIFPNPL